MFAEGPYSAQGFSCIKNTQDLVTCMGTFPGTQAVVGATGYKKVQVIYESKGLTPIRHAYDSENGCLFDYYLDIQGNLTGVTVKNRAGKSQNFLLPLSRDASLAFCQKLAP